MRKLLIAGMLLGACGGEDQTPVPIEECQLGELTGAWRVTYEETDGTCGPIPDATVIMGNGVENGVEPEGCEIYSATRDADSCRSFVDFECVMSDGSAVRWVIVQTQVSSDRVIGTGTGTVNHPEAGFCQSTYDITLTQL